MRHGQMQVIHADDEHEGVWVVCVWRDGNTVWHGPFDTDEDAEEYREEIRNE